MEEFKELFAGSASAYVEHVPTTEPDSKGKLVGKYNTIHKAPPDRAWKNHLEGRKGLVVIPLRKPNLCRWGAIDIDVYAGFDHAALATKIAAAKLPLIVARSKSGGAHCFLFLKDWTEAARVRKLLTEYAVVLGYPPTIEVFPKHESLPENYDGQDGCINLPYFDAAAGTRHGFSHTGEPISLEEFIEFAHHWRCSIEQAEACAVRPRPLNGAGGLTPGTAALLANPTIGVHRHNQLIAQAKEWLQMGLATEHFEVCIRAEAHKLYYNDPKKAEVEIEKAQDYWRKHRGGQNGQFGPLVRMQAPNGDFVTWKIGFGGGWLYFDRTEDIQSWRKVRAAVMERLSMLPPDKSDDAWRKELRHLLDDVQIEELPEEAGELSQMLDLLEAFTTDRVQGRQMEDLLLGIPFTKDGTTHFRFKDFADYLARHKYRKGVKLLTAKQLAMDLQDLGCIAPKSPIKIKGKSVKVWTHAEFERMNAPLDTPKPPKEPL